jgi:hypothetical protein
MTSLKEIIEQLKLCHFDCEGGALENNIAFIELKKLAIHQPGQQEQNILAELEETIDNWWRTYNDLDYDLYRRIPDRRGKNRFKHHHNMRTHIYKKYKMFFDCCKSPEGIQRMREFNKRVTEHLERQDQRNHVEPMETLI